MLEVVYMDLQNTSIRVAVELFDSSLHVAAAAVSCHAPPQLSVFVSRTSKASKLSTWQERAALFACHLQHTQQCPACNIFVLICGINAVVSGARPRVPTRMKCRRCCIFPPPCSSQQKSSSACRSGLLYTKTSRRCIVYRRPLVLYACMYICRPKAV